MITARALPWQCWNAPCPPRIPTGTEAPQGARGILPLLDTAGDVTVDDVELRMVRTAGMLWVCAGTAAPAQDQGMPWRLCREDGPEQLPPQTLPEPSLRVRALSASETTNGASSEPGNSSVSSPRGMPSSPALPRRSAPHANPGTGEATRDPSRVSNTETAPPGAGPGPVTSFSHHARRPCQVPGTNPSLSSPAGTCGYPGDAHQGPGSPEGTAGSVPAGDGGDSRGPA